MSGDNFSLCSIWTWRARSMGRTTCVIVCCSFSSRRRLQGSQTNCPSRWWRLCSTESTSTCSQAGWRVHWPFCRSNITRFKCFWTCLCCGSVCDWGAGQTWPETCTEILNVWTVTEHTSSIHINWHKQDVSVSVLQLKSLHSVMLKKNRDPDHLTSNRLCCVCRMPWSQLTTGA